MLCFCVPMKNLPDNISHYSLDFFSSSLNFDAIFELEKKGEAFLFEILKKNFQKYNSSTNELELLEKAFIFGADIHAHQKRESGVSYFTHPLLVALLMTPYKPDSTLLIGAMLHDAIEDSEKQDTATEIKRNFGDIVFLLVEGMSKVNALDITKSSKEYSSLQTIQKLFLYGSQDSRTLIIKLFDRLHNTITLKGKKSFEKRLKKIEETMKIYIPAIERLGIWKLKKNIENACMRVLHEEKYKKLQKLQHSSRTLSENIINILQEKLSSSFPITYESKFYSASSLILHHNSRHSPDEDFFFIRLIVPTKKDCYTLSSQLSKKFSYKKKSQRDYISNPKENGYRALQSTYVIDNAYAIRIHIVSEEMKITNDIGIFTNIYQKNYILPFLNNNIFLDMKEESELFFSYLTGDILIKKIKIHAKEKGVASLPHNITALGAGIYFYPEIFTKISQCFVNGVEEPFYTKLNDSDIVHFIFSDREVIDFEWIKYVETPFSRQKIIEKLSQKPKDEKKIYAAAAVQKIFDEYRCARVEISNAYIINILSHFSFSSLSDFYIAFAEGKISRNEIIKEILDYEAPYIPWWKQCVSNCFSFLKKGRKKKIKFSFSSRIHSIAKTSKLLNKYKEKYNISIGFAEYSSDTTGISSSISIESEDEDMQNAFIADLQSDPRIVNILFSPPLSFLVKISFFFLFPLFLSFLIFYTMEKMNNEISPIFFYFSAFFIAFFNAIGYSKIAEYFSGIRNNIRILIGVVSLNIIVTLSYVYLFIAAGLDIYHLNFYFPLLAIIVSIGFSIIFFRKKQIMTTTTIQITEDEFKARNRNKMIGYLFRLGSIITFGLFTIVGKYFLEEVPTFQMVSIACLVAGFFIALPILIFQFLKSSKSIQEKFRTEVSINLNKIFYLIVFCDFLFELFYFLSADYIPASHTSLYLTLAPILGLIVSYIFYSNHKGIFKKKILSFSLFFVATIGSVLVFLSKEIVEFSVNSLKGEIFALMLMILDVYFTFLIIRYFKLKQTFSALDFTLYLMLILGVVLLPASLHFFINNWDEITNETFISLFLLGILIFLLRYFIMESYKRCNGLINYLLMNVFPLGVILFEVLYFDFPLTLIFIIGTFLILFSSFLIEMINTYLEKKEMLENKESITKK